MTKLVPSPDWFIGLDSLDLCSQGAFVESVVTEVGLPILELSTGLRKFHEVTLTSLVNMLSPATGVIVCSHKWRWIYWLSVTRLSYLSLRQRIWWTYHYFNYPHNAVKIFSDIPIHTSSWPALCFCHWRHIAHWTVRAGLVQGWGGWAGEGEPVPMCHPHTWCLHLHTLARVTHCSSAAVLQCPARQLVTHSRNM